PVANHSLPRPFARLFEPDPMGFCPLSEASRPRTRSKGHVAAGTPLGRALPESHDELARTVRYNYRAPFHIVHRVQRLAVRHRLKLVQEARTLRTARRPASARAH